MPDPAALVNPTVEELTEERLYGPLVEAVIVTTPPDTSTPVYAVVEDFHQHLRFGPCPWQPRLIDAGSYGTPSKGDRCLLAISNEEEAWVVMWWPYD